MSQDDLVQDAAEFELIEAEEFCKNYDKDMELAFWEHAREIVLAQQVEEIPKEEKELRVLLLKEFVKRAKMYNTVAFFIQPDKLNP